MTTTGRIGRIALGDVIGRTARTCGDDIALVDDDVRISYRALDEESDRFARYLLTEGLQRGDRVAMVCVNSYRFVIAMFGILKAGLVWVPINTMLAPGDIAYIAEHAEAKLALIDAHLYANEPLRTALEAVVPRIVIVPSADSPCHPELVEGCATDFDSARAAHPTGEVDVAIADRDLALIMYTSGTTGRPKGVMHTHLSVFTAALSNLADMPMRRGEATPLLLPMFHCATHAIMLTAMLVGARGIVFRSFDPVRMMTAFERERVSFAFLLPAMWSAILDHPDRAKFDLSSLRLGLYAMAPISEPVRRRLIAEICPNFQLSSGQTEMYPATVVFRPDEQLRRFGNYWGTSAPVNETAIMDDDGNLLDRGQVGEIVHRGPNVMEGYFKDPEATAAARRFGWHHTGDLGMFDQDGQLLFVDRKKDLIKSGGENVASVKVEAALLAHPAVASVGVVGIPHERWGEAVVGFVALKPGTSATEDELIAHCRERLAGFETPKVVRILDGLPMTATGKVQKHQLRAARNEMFTEIVM
ncbi:MAG TPA: AMP-binding protein [Candidatus Elarobacter sp.]|nr:AMP-binding protein [Candidatus Elarobacter sp.]